RRRHTILQGDWSSDVCSSDLAGTAPTSSPIANANTAGRTPANAPSPRSRPVSPGNARTSMTIAARRLAKRLAEKGEAVTLTGERSEERRVGEEGRGRSVG